MRKPVRASEELGIKPPDESAFPADAALAPPPTDWKKTFEVIDAAAISEDFLQDRKKGTPEIREPL